MPLQLSKEKPILFRITHVDNLPWILENGLHARSSGQFDPNFRSIGSPDLIARRSKRVVPVAPGGVLDDYIPFYFTPYSIMLYNIHTGQGVKHVPKEEIVFLVANLNEISQRSAPFVFTNQHAYPPIAEYYNRLDRLDEIDWEILQERNFKNDPEDPGKKERYQAEALIWKHIPLDWLMGVCCYSTEVEQQILRKVQALNLSLKVAVRPSWYF